MNKIQIRAYLYVLIAILTTLQGGMKAGMTGIEWFLLIIAAVLSGAIAYRAYIDTTPAEPLPPLEKILPPAK